MVRSRPLREAHRLKQELRARLSAREYTTLVTQLEGAVAGITLLRRRAPAFLDHFLEEAELVRTDSITVQTQHALKDLVDELRGTSPRRRPPKSAGPRRPILVKR